MLSFARRALPLAAALALTVSLTACFRPLHGPTASGAELSSVLASIDVDEVAVPPLYERFSHYLRSELVFDLNGSGQQAQKRYKLQLAFSGNVGTPLVDTTTGRAQSATLNGSVTYTLVTATGEVVTRGKVTAAASYDRNVQRFASLRAGRDAEIRLARTLADMIRTRVSAELATRA
ncbi:MAG TPA: LPS assembly lipoprotein LptE [Microvirga sp.]|jgi:LPS-assembly lipoprotein